MGFIEPGEVGFESAFKCMKGLNRIRELTISKVYYLKYIMSRVSY